MASTGLPYRIEHQLPDRSPIILELAFDLESANAAFMRQLRRLEEETAGGSLTIVNGRCVRERSIARGGDLSHVTRRARQYSISGIHVLKEQEGDQPNERSPCDAGDDPPVAAVESRPEPIMGRPGSGDDAPQCFQCVHWTADLDVARCAAFPQGIPLAIWHGRVDHRFPVAGDRGVRFEAANADEIDRRLARLQSAVEAAFCEAIGAV
jgi:hypothetical protein